MLNNIISTSTANITFTVNTLEQLEKATLTNVPEVELPEEYDKEAEAAAISYVNMYALRQINKEVAGDISEFVTPVKNRIVNLAAPLIEKGIITSPKAIKNLLKSNLQLQELEEKAILEAYHSGEVPEAKLYITIFFSFKVYNFMKTYGLLGVHDADMVYLRMQDEALLSIVDKFDFNRIQHGGLCTAYTDRLFTDYFRSEFIAKSSVTTSCRMAREFNIIKKMGCFDEFGDAEDKLLSTKELAKKYKVSSNSIIAYNNLKNVLCLDASVQSDGSEEEGEKRKYGSLVADPDDHFRNSVEIPLLYEQFYAYLENTYNIDKETALEIMTGVVAYKELHNERVKISEREKRELSEEIDIPVNVISIVLKEFGDLFFDVI